jgi:hypothetical protein
MPAPEKPFYFLLLSGSTPEKASHRFVYVLSVSSNLVLSIDLAIDSFLSRTILVSNSVPLRFVSPSFQSSPLCIRLDILNVFTISSIHSSPFPPCLSAVSTFVLVSISSMSSLQYRRYALIRPSSSPPSFPTFPSAIFNFYHLAFDNVPSYSVHLLLILLGSLSVPPLFLFTFPNVVSYVPASPTPTYA